MSLPRLVLPAAAWVGLALAGCGAAQDDHVGGGESPAALAAAKTITEEDILRRLSVIAHDSMLGRATPSPELDEVARWAAAEFEKTGLRPAFSEGWVQEYTIRTEVPDFETSAASLGGRSLAFGESVGMPFGPQAESEVDAPLLVISGIRGWQRSLAVEELAGAAVLIVGNRDEPGPRSQDALQMFNLIRDANPALVVFAVDLPDQDWAAAIEHQGETSVTRPLGFGGVPVLSVRDQVLQGPLHEKGIDLAELRDRAGGTVQTIAVPDLPVRASVRNRVLVSESAPNVAALLPGSDSALADEVIVLSAHMDHVGVGRPDAAGDSIYNGADDDASGTVTIIEVAEALASLDPAPRRSFVFLLVSGEEQGLWGSRWFAEHPPVPMSDMVANLNLDMVGRNWDDTIVVIGKEHSDLGSTLSTVNDRHPELRMQAIDDLWPEDGYYFRSDHYNFASRGVPVLFFFNGIHGDYHEPGDEVDKIDGEKTARIGRLVYYLGLEIASRDVRPRWDPKSYERIAGG